MHFVHLGNVTLQMLTIKRHTNIQK